MTVSAKKRALAQRTGSLGSNSASGAISAINSMRTADSAIFSEAGEGESDASSGPPYASAGTYLSQSKISLYSHCWYIYVTLLAGLIFGACPSGLFLRSTSKRLYGSLVSLSASSVFECRKRECEQLNSLSRSRIMRRT